MSVSCNAIPETRLNTFNSMWVPYCLTRHLDLEIKEKTPKKICSCFKKMYSVQFSRSVMSDSLRPHELQHARPPCPSPTPGVHSNSCPSSRWCHPAISSSVVLFSSCPQSLPASEPFPISQLFSWGDQSTGVSALASFLPKNTQDWQVGELERDFLLVWHQGLSLFTTPNCLQKWWH